jgi:hypothetical protein
MTLSPNQVPTLIRAKTTPIGTGMRDLSQTLKILKYYVLGYVYFFIKISDKRARRNHVATHNRGLNH